MEINKILKTNINKINLFLKAKTLNYKRKNVFHFLIGVKIILKLQLK
jgi:hypothetical protein